MTNKKKKTTGKSTENKDVKLVSVPSFGFIKDELNKIGEIRDGFNKAQLEFVRNSVNKDLTDIELLVFLSFSTKLQLNPVLKEIVAVVYDKSDPAKRMVKYIVPRDGKRIVASRSGGLNAVIKEAIYIKKVKPLDKDGKAISEEHTVRVKPWEGGTLWGATATVTRNGIVHEVTVPLSEYDTKQNVWATKPETMIKKVAESQALTAAFPELLAGIYDDAEYGSMSNGNGRKQIEVPNGDGEATPRQMETLEEMLKAGTIEEIPEGVTRQQALEIITSKPKKAEKEKK